VPGWLTSTILPRSLPRHRAKCSTSSIGATTTGALIGRWWPGVQATGIERSLLARRRHAGEWSGH
jgi:hypothetical protein